MSALYQFFVRKAVIIVLRDHHMVQQGNVAGFQGSVELLCGLYVCCPGERAPGGMIMDYYQAAGFLFQRLLQYMPAVK